MIHFTLNFAQLHRPAPTYFSPLVVGTFLPSPSGYWDPMHVPGTFYKFILGVPLAILTVVVAR